MSKQETNLKSFTKSDDFFKSFLINILEHLKQVFLAKIDLGQ